MWADEQLNPAESYAWRKWAGHHPSEPRRKKKRKKKRLPRPPRPRQGCRRLCDHQRQVPAVRSSVVTQRQVPTVHSFMLPVQFLDKVLDMPIVVQRQVLRSMVQKTVESPQLHFIDGRRHPLSLRRSSSSWSSLFSGSLRFRSCRSFFGGRCPCCAGRADSQVPPWRRPRFFFCRQARCSASWLVWLIRTVMLRHSCAWLVLLVTMQLSLEEEEEEETSSQLFTSSLGCLASWSVWSRRTFMPRHRDRFRCPRCTHLETWTFYEPLVSGTLFGACHAGGTQENLKFSGSSLRGIISMAPCIWQSLVRCILRHDSLLFQVRPWSTRVWIFLEDGFWFAFRIQFSLVRQWIHTWRQSTRPFGFHTA